MKRETARGAVLLLRRGCFELASRVRVLVAWLSDRFDQFFVSFQISPLGQKKEEREELGSLSLWDVLPGVFYSIQSRDLLFDSCGRNE